MLIDNDCKALLGMLKNELIVDCNKFIVRGMQNSLKFITGSTANAKGASMNQLNYWLMLLWVMFWMMHCLIDCGNLCYEEHAHMLM